MTPEPDLPAPDLPAPDLPAPDLAVTAFLDLAPPPGGLAGVQARLARQQVRRRVGGGLALAALALLVVLPQLGPPTPPPDPHWTSDVALSRVTTGGPRVESRGPVGVVEVGRTHDMVMVRVLARPTPARSATTADAPPTATGPPESQAP